MDTAAFYGHVDAVRVLIDAGADVNHHPSDWPVESALSTAARYGHTEVVRELLASGASADGDAGEGALHNAVRFQDKKMERLLVEAGANE